MIRPLQTIALATLLFIFFSSGTDSLWAQSSKAPVKSSHLVVSFSNSDRMMLGYFYRPEGDGPFPAVIFHHRDHKSLMNGEVSRFEKLAQFYTSRGYILFLPDRHSDQFANEEFSTGLQQKLANNPNASATRDQSIVERTEIINRDVVASIEWLQKNPDVNTNRIVVTGMWAGAMQSLIAMEKVNVSACVLFSPATMSWKDNFVTQGTLIHAARKSPAPIFLIYSEDQNLAPAEALNTELEKKGKPNQLKIYPAMKTEKSALFPIDGFETWGPDVMKFLKKAAK